MPSDDSASSSRSRRLLGRGPGAAPPPPDAEPPAPVTPAAAATAVPTGVAGAAPVVPAAEPPVEPVDRAEPAAVLPAPAEAPDGATEAPSAAPAQPEPVDTPEAPQGALSGSPEPAAPEDGAESSPEAPAGEADGKFTVRLANFEGPFDLLLQLISKHKLDVTEVALSKVTDEFMVHIRAMGTDWDLDQMTEFLVVAATLLDLKAARLLPAAEVEDEEDLALLEARDLLFARLLQYRAYKRIAAIFADRLEAESLHHPRTVGLEPHHAELLPEVVLSIGLERFAQLAVKAMQPKPKPQVYVDHIHAPLVSVREQAEHMIAVLRERGEASFRELTLDAPDTLTVVARFLALLELYREKAVALDQEEALGDLLVRWTGGEGEPEQPLVTDEFDQDPAARKDGKDD
ncbi:segregation/condensation protein A [Streptomyces sp. NPDC002574]|uniref:segregation and condensation protein A n=1 Tax=Streptomyces sp. NPDC002574 TaxID=3364652 RepID=UPI0036A43229